MADPIVFISHFRVKEGRVEALREMFGQMMPLLEADKPRTIAQLGYLDDLGAGLSIVHVFPDAAAMAEHFGGSAERSSAGYEVFAPAGWEIYGTPTQAVLDQMRREAAAAGVGLTVKPDYVAGFLRAASR
jgi:hypothetical protein